MGSRTRMPDTGAEQWDYVTYAPPGQKCLKCRRPIGALEPCRRRDDDRASRGPLVTYTHIACPEAGGTK